MTLTELRLTWVDMGLVKIELEKESSWPSDISNLSDKLAIADRLASKLTSDVIVGVGSGSTAYLALKSLSARAKSLGFVLRVVGTSVEIERVAMALGAQVISLAQSFSLGGISWSFDGVDEVDPDGRMLKGRGGAMYREKLLMASSHKVYILADSSKFVQKLGSHFAVPIEVDISAIDLVRSILEDLGATSCPLRTAGSGKDGPVITESGSVILDAGFDGDIPGEEMLDAIPGVICSGIFDQWPYDLFGSDT